MYLGESAESTWYHGTQLMEIVQFVNPPRLQSVPGFSHFHVFARRKTPGEIDASEVAWTKEA